MPCDSGAEGAGKGGLNPLLDKPCTVTTPAGGMGLLSEHAGRLMTIAVSSNQGCGLSGGP